MHNIYKFLTDLNKKAEVKENNKEKSIPQVAVVTENEKEEVKLWENVTKIQDNLR